MSLAIAFKSAEGIVLAADSRVTLTAQLVGGPPINATYDNATKLLRVQSQKYVGAVIYGVAALGGNQPRTIHSYLPELEESLGEKNKRLSVEAFAEALSTFFAQRWAETMPAGAAGDVVFLVGGYNEGEAYGRVYEFKVPNAPKPVEKNSGDANFGISWGGQLEYTSRLLHGMDPKLLGMVKEHLNLSDAQVQALSSHLTPRLAIPIPYQFLPLQDCIDLSILLIRTTANLLGYTVGVRGVGGPVDVAVVTRTGGFRAVQQKRLSGSEETAAILEE